MLMPLQHIDGCCNVESSDHEGSHGKNDDAAPMQPLHEPVAGELSEEGDYQTHQEQRQHIIQPATEEWMSIEIMS